MIDARSTQLNHSGELKFGNPVESFFALSTLGAKGLDGSPFANSFDSFFAILMPPQV
jgi:hypothetical protein